MSNLLHRLPESTLIHIMGYNGLPLFPSRELRELSLKWLKYCIHASRKGVLPTYWVDTLLQDNGLSGEKDGDNLVLLRYSDNYVVTSVNEDGHRIQNRWKKYDITCNGVTDVNESNDGESSDDESSDEEDRYTFNVIAYNIYKDDNIDGYVSVATVDNGSVFPYFIFHLTETVVNREELESVTTTITHGATRDIHVVETVIPQRLHPLLKRIMSSE